MTFKYDLISLFELIEARHCLWNKNSEDFKNKTLREKAWQEIFSTLDDTYEEQSRDEKKKTGLIIMSKWANIRDAFIRSLKLKNGQTAKKKYLYADFLQFLLTCQEQNETENSIICADDDNSVELTERESQANYHIIDFVDTNSIHDTNKVKRSKRDSDNIENETLDLKRKEPEYNCNKEENFFISFLPYIYDMTESEKLELHMDILKSIKNIKQSRTHSRLHSLTNQCTSTFHIKTDITKGKPCHRILMDNPIYKPDFVPLSPGMPENVMLINSLHEANTCLRKLVRMISDTNTYTENNSCCLSEKNQIVVYGDCIEAYSCIAALLELGISANNIAFVEPFPPTDSTAMRVNCFNNETVDERVQAGVGNLGVHIYRRCYFQGWSQKELSVDFLRLMTSLHAIHLPCFALFYFGIKAIDLNAFKAINDSGLVYDGGLVVGPWFDTNDPHVFGAGPCVKYSRRLYASHHLHKYYCSEDVGEALARFFLRKLDPFLTSSAELNPVYSESTHRYSSCLLACRSSHASVASTGRSSVSLAKSRWQPVMKFDSPVVQSATLPGPLYYMQLRGPGQDVPMAVKLLLSDQGHTLITDKRQNYFRLQINALHCIESITCLSKRQFSCETFTQLYGKHEAYFNNLLGRFKINLIDDLYEYFTQTWTAALYQEPFSVLLKNIYEQGGNTVYDVVKTKYNEFYGDGKTDNKSFQETSSEGVAERKTGCKECGQNEALRHESATFWKAIGGDNIVHSLLARYLNKNIVINPQYAVPDKEFL